MSNLSDFYGYRLVPSNSWIDGGTITSNTQLQTGRSYYVNSANATLTLPASPTTGVRIQLIDMTGAPNQTLARNGSTIQGVAADMTLDQAYYQIIFEYTNSSWTLENHGAATFAAASGVPFTADEYLSSTNVQAAIQEAYGDYLSTQSIQDGRLDGLDSYVNLFATYKADRIVENTTYYVKTSGGDFTSIGDALSYVDSLVINPPYVVTIEIDDGAWDISSNLASYSPFIQRIRLKGKTLITLTSTSIASSSGSSGNYSYVINTGSTTGVEIGDYCIIGNGSGGVNPNYLVGCWEITGVAANTVTINVKQINASKASGAVVSTIYVPKTRIVATDCHGISSVVNGRGFSDIYNLTLVGNANASYAGLNASGNSYLYAANLGPLGIANFGYGVRLVDNSSFAGGNGFYLGVGGCVYGFFLERNSQAIFTKMSVGGCSGAGIHIYRAGYAYVNSTNYVYGNAIGIYAASNGFATSINSGQLGGNTTDYSPSVNTLGNEGGYIDQ